MHIAGAANQNPQAASLTEGGINLNARLCDIRDRINRIADSIHGGALKSASEGKGAPPPINSLRRNLDLAQTHIGEIEAELSRIENGL
jgi:hypothetical protein